MAGAIVKRAVLLYIFNTVHNTAANALSSVECGTASKGPTWLYKASWRSRQDLGTAA